MTNNMSINKELEGILIGILKGSGEFLKDRLQELYKSENKTHLEKCITDIYQNLDNYSKEHGLTMQEKLQIESQKIEVLKVLRNNTKWTEIKSFIGIGIAILGSAVAAGIILALVNNKSDDLLGNGQDIELLE